MIASQNSGIDMSTSVSVERPKSTQLLCLAALTIPVGMASANATNIPPNKRYSVRSNRSMIILATGSWLLIE